jgi:hypothetical protein
MSGGKMTNDEIIRIAKAVRLGEVDDDGDIWCSDGFYTEEIDSFAQLAYDAGRKAEREACAKVCEALDDGKYAGGDQPYGLHYARAIRARGQV